MKDLFEVVNVLLAFAGVILQAIALAVSIIALVLDRKKRLPPRDGGKSQK